jgi:hypothetical protein
MIVDEHYPSCHSALQRGIGGLFNPQAGVTVSSVDLSHANH